MEEEERMGERRGLTLKNTLFMKNLL